MIAIALLANSENGLPVEGSYELLENWRIWEIAHHAVVYELEQYALYVWLIKANH